MDPVKIPSFEERYKGMTLHFGEALIWSDHGEVDVIEGDIKAYGFAADRLSGGKIRVLADRQRETDTERAGKVKECAGAFLRDHMNRLAGIKPSKRRKKPTPRPPRRPRPKESVPKAPTQLSIDGLV